ncbi:uncharacterized protein SPAPADRAFT_51425 [Spathaspora passalidarum NRRL Y-27907]|uniref:WW domain-containing protein n=1 Tax=Spathaspora passalidarum (strain NRRL Y-27907 / 11-Y1) TaxID=619300 RepID=G3AQ60_SPAPN|nr:uncharacterized protein SPAPADRAFT_51425 [Spathaspora passalidarum NRRL Y-27907]EGW31407.1 hypothetical protein SPAPADRAFT_51425 [Spathaspora passalidarum NRRL Y-27907]
MTPQFVYKLPLQEWHLIITNTGHHFYFNEKTSKSYWQLSDIQALGIDVETFLNGVNFDELALLFAKARGLKIDEVVENQEEIEWRSEEVEIVIERGDVVSGEKEKEVRELNHEPESEQTQIIQGYSSSEEDYEDEEEEKEENVSRPEQDLDIDQLAATAIEQYQHSDSETDSEASNDLDLSFDDNSSSEDFISLLEQFKSKISPFEPWELIEERLISEFVKYPEFYTIDSKSKREEIFRQWSKQQEDEEEQDQEEEEVVNIYPTPTIEYLAFLQNFKSEIKNGFYQPFYSKHYKSINSFNLTPQQKETIFRNYKLMLSESSIAEREYKKANSKSGNFKVMKLTEFLKQFNLSGGKVNYNSDESFFTNWIDLLNVNQVDLEIAENQINFLVGDEKRFVSYKSALE